MPDDWLKCCARSEACVLVMNLNAFKETMILFIHCSSFYVQKFDISELVAKRMDAQRRLQSDPNDIEALLILQEIQMKMQNWCQSNVKPGQFTGELVKNLLPKEHLQGGYQAWAKKVLFLK